MLRVSKARERLVMMTGGGENEHSIEHSKEHFFGVVTGHTWWRGSGEVLSFPS